MKKFIVSEDGLNAIKQNILKESYGDKIEIIRKYLDDNFMRATFEKDGENVGIFVKLSNHIPTDKSMWKQDVLDILDKEFNNIITDKKGRDGFLNQVVDDWYNKKFSKYGSLSKYDW